MEPQKNISNAQMKVMDIIWRKEAAVTVPEMVALLNEEGMGVPDGGDIFETP